MDDPHDRQRRIAAARAEFLSTGMGRVDGVPDVVAASWVRSASAGVPDSNLSLRYYDDLDVASRLVRCAAPIIARLRDQTADLALSIALTDSKARILSRTDTSRTIGMLLERVSLSTGFGYAENEAGTNGIGTVLESGASVHIDGLEHFVEPLQRFSCAGAPIRDPLTRRVEGILDITSLAKHSSPLMHSLVRSTATQIERELLVDHSQCQQALFDTFLRTDARTRDAVMAVGDSLVMMNDTAQNLLSAEDQVTLQEHTRFLMTYHDAPEDLVELASGAAVRVRGTRIMVGNDIAGMVVVITGFDQPMPDALDDLVLPPPARSPWSSVHQRVELPKFDGPIVEGRTPAWRSAASGIAAALRGKEALLVIGESGTGKFTLLTELYHSIQPSGRSLHFDAADIASGSYRDAEFALEAGTVPTLYIVRALHRLATEGVGRLDQFLASTFESGRPVTIAATVSDAGLESGLPFCELLPHFKTSVTLPPLRQRSADIGALAARLLSELAPDREVGLSPEAMQLISRYTWPRNIAQLKEALASALVKRPVGTIDERDLPGYCHTTVRRTLSPLEEADRDAVIAALKASGGNRVHAAKALGLARSSLYRRLKDYGITDV